MIARNIERIGLIVAGAGLGVHFIAARVWAIAVVFGLLAAGLAYVYQRFGGDI